VVTFLNKHGYSLLAVRPVQRRRFQPVSTTLSDSSRVPADTIHLTTTVHFWSDLLVEMALRLVPISSPAGKVFPRTDCR